jgi:hypothetical protein
MHQWDRYGFDKKRFRTCFAELVFLHPLGSVCHVVQSGVSEVRNIDTLFFMLGWDQYGFDKKCFRTCCGKLVFFASGGISRSHNAFRCVRGTKYRHTIFHARWD